MYLTKKHAILSYLNNVHSFWQHAWGNIPNNEISGFSTWDVIKHSSAKDVILFCQQTWGKTRLVAIPL